MTKKNGTKRSLLMSAVALVLCFSMLVGSTFAWFTDSVTSTGNIIASGKLDVEMSWADGTKAVPVADSTDWTDASNGPIFKYDLWEPGYVEVKHIQIKNAGTLALKYQLSIAANGAVSDLADVIDVYYSDPAVQVADRTALAAATPEGTLTQMLAGMTTTASGELQANESHTVTIALKMQESAGNQYMEKSIGSEFAVKLVATQLESEDDSFDIHYDKMATIDDEAELTAALAADYDLIQLGANIALTNTVTIPAGKTVAIDLMGYTISQTKECTEAYSMIANNGSLTIKDSIGTGKITLNDTGANSGSSWGTYTIRNDGTLVVENGTIENIAPNSTGNVNNAIFSYAGDTTIKGGTFNVPYSRSVRQWNGTLTIEDGIFDGQVWVQAMSDVTTTISGGSFKPATHGNDGSSVFVTNGDHDVNLSVTGGTFATKLGMTVPEKCVTGGTFGSIADNIVADGYAAAKNSDGTWKVISGLSHAAAQAAIDNATDGAVIELTAGVQYGTLLAKSNITIKGADGAVVDCINLNGAQNVTLEKIEFDAAGAQEAYDAHNGGTRRSYANIISASKGADNGARNIVIDGCTFTGKFENAGAAIAFADRSRKTTLSGNVTVKNCKFNTENANYDVYGYYTGATGMTFTFEGNTFASECRGGSIYLGRLKTSAVIVVNGNAFMAKASLEDAVYVQGDGSYNPTLSATDNTFGG